MTSFGVSTTFLVVSFTSGRLVVTLPFAIGGFVFGGPIVHWANGNIGKGFISLGMNLGGSAVGAAIGALLPTFDIRPDRTSVGLMGSF